MPTLLLGSIGTLADTSELQRAAFNEAFRAHGLPWFWDRDIYREMLRQSGGRDRIAKQAQTEGRDVDAAAVHATKSALFQDMLQAGQFDLRPGILELIQDTRRAGHPVAFVTTTSAANVDRLLDALVLDPALFDVTITRDDVAAPKPDPACYRLAVQRLEKSAPDCIAIEDNSDGVLAAQAAGLSCLAWPNSNTGDHDFHGARVVSGDIRAAMNGPEVAAL
ncbi:MAG: HAD-IA family hydrolase [Pseudomonadota bacterium]